METPRPMFSLAEVDPALTTAYAHMKRIDSPMPRSTAMPDDTPSWDRISERKALMRNNNSLCAMWLMILLLTIMIGLLYAILYLGLHPCMLADKSDSYQMVMINQTIQDLLDLNEINKDYRQFIQTNSLLQDWIRGSIIDTLL